MRAMMNRTYDSRRQKTSIRALAAVSALFLPVASSAHDVRETFAIAAPSAMARVCNGTLLADEDKCTSTYRGDMIGDGLLVPLVPARYRTQVDAEGATSAAAAYREQFGAYTEASRPLTFAHAESHVSFSVESRAGRSELKSMRIALVGVASTAMGAEGCGSAWAVELWDDPLRVPDKQIGSVSIHRPLEGEPGFPEVELRSWSCCSLVTNISPRPHLIVRGGVSGPSADSLGNELPGREDFQIDGDAALVEPPLFLSGELGSGVARHSGSHEVRLRSGRRYHIRVNTTASTAAPPLRGGCLAVVDPVVLPEPSDPDLFIVVNTPVSPGNEPFIPKEVQNRFLERGYDLTPLAELGLLTEVRPGDVAPPVTHATSDPLPSPSGWNRTPVTVTLRAEDEPGGSGVARIEYALSGAHEAAATTVAAASVDIPISAEGETTVTYRAHDAAGNDETLKTLTVRLDTTPPVLTGLPAAGCTLWPPNRALVRVAAVTVIDALSGVAPGTLQVRASSSEPAPGDVVVAGNEVLVRVSRDGAGPGRVYTAEASASDMAGNVAHGSATCTVPHDQRKRR